MSSKPTKTWDNFFGPDPLLGRVNDLSGNPYIKSLFSGPISHQNFINTFHEAQALAAKLNKTDPSNMQIWAKDVVSSTPVKLSRQSSLDERTMQRRTTFAAVVASNSTGNLQQYCIFCEANREGFAVYSTHTTDNCLILKKYICPICGVKGHTISHCKFNSSGGSVVTGMRRHDELSRIYDENFP